MEQVDACIASTQEQFSYTASVDNDDHDDNDDGEYNDNDDDFPELAFKLRFHTFWKNQSSI